MGYGQWCQIIIKNGSTSTITSKNLDWKSGKFFVFPDADNEIKTPEDTVNREIKPRSLLSFAQCGRENATYGCDSALELWCGNDQICRLYWSVPQGSNQKCELSITDLKTDRFDVAIPPIYVWGSMGSVEIKVTDHCE